MITQTVALFVDAYRELNAKKLFWITMLLSGLVVLIYAAIGIDEEGVSILWFRIGFIPVTSEQIPPAMLYKSLFVNLGLGVWLTWIATVLALISTAGIIPEMISGGSIEMLLSKPISRTRLFLTKYATGLLFAGLQVAAFTTASFLVIGIRGGAWEPGLFLAIPLVVVFFSYLFGVCALVGVLTRSTIAALLLTLLFWFMCFVLNFGDAIVMGIRVSNEARVDAYTTSIETKRADTTKILTARHTNQGDPLPADYVATDEDIIGLTPWASLVFEQRTKSEEMLDALRPWAMAKTVIPKTGETIGLLERWLISMADLKTANQIDETHEAPKIDKDTGEIEMEDSEVSLRAQEVIRSRPVWWVLGTSLLFEGVVLGIAALVFRRRDH